LLLAQFWLTFESSSKGELKVVFLGIGIQGIMKISKVKENNPMSQTQPTIYTNQPSTTTLPIDPTPLLENGNSPTAIILAIALLLWVLRPVMLPNNSVSSKKK
jgi:hypothetical protein